MSLWQRLFGRSGYNEIPLIVRDEGETQTARSTAEDALAHTRAQGQEVESVVESLRRLREENHFGQAIERAMLRRDTNS